MDTDDKQYLLSLLGETKDLQLLWRATEHGGGKISDFHAKCDGKGPTVVLFKTSTGRRCGGYTSIKWDNHSHFMSDA